MQIDLSEIKDLIVAIDRLTAVISHAATTNADLTPTPLPDMEIEQVEEVAEVEEESPALAPISLTAVKELFTNIARETGKRDELHQIVADLGGESLADLTEENRSVAAALAADLADSL